MLLVFIRQIYRSHFHDHDGCLRWSCRVLVYLSFLYGAFVHWALYKFIHCSLLHHSPHRKQLLKDNHESYHHQHSDSEGWTWQMLWVCFSGLLWHHHSLAVGTEGLAFCKTSCLVTGRTAAAEVATVPEVTDSPVRSG